MSCSRRSAVCSLLVFLSSITAAWAGPVTGRVVDPDGRAVRGATVLLVDGATVIGTAVTDAAGGFSLTAPHDGPFHVRVAADGFRAQPVSVAGDSNAGTITLEVSAVRESVVVSASQVDTPLSSTSSSVTVLTGEDLKTLQAQTLADALRLVPGLTVTSTGGHGALTSLFPRGGESDYSLVLVDGVPANAFGGGFDVAHVPVIDVERIEVVRGPQSALFGSNAIGSVIRIVTKRGGSPVAGAVVEGGTFGTVRIAGATSGGAGPWQWGASLDRIASDGMNGRRTAAGVLVENDDYRRWTLAGSAGWSGAGGAALRADARYTDDERGFPGPFGSDPGGTFSGIDTQRGRNERTLASVSGAAPAWGRVRLTAQLTHSRTAGVVTSEFPESRTSSRRTAARAQSDVTLPAGLQGSIGGEITGERARSTFITARDSTTVAPREVPVERTLAGVFGEVRWNRESRLFLNAGVRAERIERAALPGSASSFSARPDFSDDVITSVNPKIAASWFVRSAAGSFTKLRAAAGTGIRPPDAFEIAFTDNPSLKPERSRSWEAGIDQAFAGGLATVEATAFHNRYDDLIVAVGSFRGSSRYRTDNISNAMTRGLELSGAARARVASERRVDLQVRVALTFLDTEILAVDGGADAPPPFRPGDRLLRRPARQFSTELVVRGGSLSGFLTAGGRSRTRDVDPSFGTFGGLFDTPGYAVVTVGGAWRPLRQIEVFGRVANLFDRQYEEALGFPALGRAAIVGLRVAAGH
jgi:outer membrane cobalamin receptor